MTRARRALLSIAALLLAGPARAQVILPTGETLQITRVWDFVDVLQVNPDGSLTVHLPDLQGAVGAPGRPGKTPLTVQGAPFMTPVAVTQTNPNLLNVNATIVGGSVTIPGTVTVSGTVAATQSGLWSTGRTWTLSSGTDSVAAVESGVWTVQPGNTANTTPWLTTISQGGNAATVSAGGALKVDGSAVTQPVSGTVAVSSVAGNVTVVQPTAANLNATVTDGSGPLTVDGTVTANAGTGVFDVTPVTPAANDYLPVRLTDGSAFYSATGGAGGSSTTEFNPQTPTNTATSTTAALIAAQNAVFGVAGAPGSRVQTVQGAPFMTPVLVAQPDPVRFNTTTWAKATSSAPVYVNGAISPLSVDLLGNLRIVCTSGCAGSSFADAAAFTFGTTTIANSGYVVDDTATNVVAENSAGAPRMNTNRIAYSNLRNNAGIEAGTLTGPLFIRPTDGSNAATPFDLDLDSGGFVTTNRQSIGIGLSVNGGPVPLEGGAGNGSGLEYGAYTRLLQTNSVNLGSTGWTSATSVDSAVSVSTLGFATVVVTLNRSSTVSAGVANFEASDDSGTTWYPVYGAVANAASQTVAISQSLAALASTQIQVGVEGFTNFRVRLNPVITGVGTINVRVTPNTSPAGRQTLSTIAIQNAAFQNNLTQVVSNTANTGTGAAGTGTLRVAVASDSSIASIGTSVTPGTAAANLGKAEDAAHASGDTGVETLAVRNQAATVLTSADGDYSPVAVDAYGATFVAPHPGKFSCIIQGATVTTQCQAAPAAGLRAYVSSVSCSNQTAGVQTLDVVYGTGAACATGTTAISHKWQFGTAAITTSPFVINWASDYPMVPAAANAICVRPSAATAFGCLITGYIAP